MPLDASSIIQINSGNFEAASGTVSLGAATTAGSMVVVAATVMSDGSGAASELSITGFDRLGWGVSDKWQNVYMLTKFSSGGETSWTLNVSVGGSRQVVWTVMEIEGVDPEVWPYAGIAGIYLQNDATPASPVSALLVESTSSGAYDVLGIAVHASTAASGVTPAISGHTNNWQELASVNRSNVSRGLRQSVSARNYLSLGPLSVEASISPSSPASAMIIVLVGAGARLAPIVNVMCGFEFGTASSLTQSGTSNDLAVFDEVTGTPEVVSTFKRTGSYALRLSSSAAIENASWIMGENLTGSGLQIGAAPLCFYFDTSLPSGDVELFSMEAASSGTNSVKVWYRSASQKIGVKVGTGTEQLSDATVAANKWIGVEVRYDPRTTTHTCDWYVDYDSTDATGPVPQTQASNTGMTAGVVTRFRLGWTASTTATVYYDDVLVYSTPQAFPMGMVDIRPLRPDTGGTATTSGSSSAFNTFTNNGTMAAFTSAAAINALDEIPPVVGASSNGVAQVTASSGNYCRVPLQTYGLAPDDVARGVRMYSLGWAAGTAAASITVQAYDGDASTHPMGGDITDAGFDSASYWWMTVTFKDPSGSAYVVSQTVLDALAIEFGSAGDATPDVGVLFALAEVATQPAQVFGIMESGDGFSVYVRQDPASGAVASYLVTTPSGTRGATFSGVIRGTPFSQYVGPNTTYEHNVAASDISEVTEITLSPDATT